MDSDGMITKRDKGLMYVCRGTEKCMENYTTVFKSAEIKFVGG